MKKLLFAVAISILLIPISRPLQGQEGGFGGGGGDSVDLSGLLGDRGGRGGFGGPGNGGRGGYQLPDSKVMFSEIQSTLKKGKTPLDKSQEKPLRSMLDLEVVNLSDRIQVLRSSNSNGGGNNGTGGFQGRPDFAGGFPPDGGFPGGGRPDFAGGFPGGGGNFPAGGNSPGTPDQAASANSIANTLTVQTETITSLKNDDFLANKISAFLSPEQVALVQKAKAEDKENATCLGGLLDRVSNGLQNNAGRGNNNNGNNRGNFFNNNNTRKSNGQAYCMTAEATATERLEPIRKVLAAGNLPLGKDKEPIAEAFLKSQIKDLEDSLRSTLTASFSGNRGGGGINNRSNNPQMIIQSTTDNMYKKAEAMLNPPQAETLKKWHFQQIMDRGGIETLIAIEAMQDTPLTDDQVARVTAAWPELRNQLQSAAKAAKKNLPDKDLDNSTMAKVLEMLEPAQVTSFQDARKYAPGK